MQYITHKSGIKIFEYIHPENLTVEFLKGHNLSEGSVFLIEGTPYRVTDDFGDGDLSANEVKSIGLDEWVLNGNSHPRVKWHGSYATYEGCHSRPILVPYNGMTYFCHPHTGEILESVENECPEYGISDSFGYTGEVGIGSWSDKGYW